MAEVFGPSVNRTCVIVLTKEPLSLARAQARQSACEEANLPFVLWENSREDDDTNQWVEISQYQWDTQTGNLIDAIKKVENYEMTTLKQLKEEVLAEAQKRREEEPVQYQTVTYQATEDYLEPYQVAVQKLRPIQKRVWAGRAGKITGKKKTVWENEPYTDYETRHQSKTRTLDRQHQFEVPKKSLQHYIEVVHKEKMDSFRQTVLQNAHNESLETGNRSER